MYSFSSRPDCKVFDEPLYPNHLRVQPELYRPYREELLQKHTASGNEVIMHVQEQAKEQLVYAKHIIKQLTPDIDTNAFFAPGNRHLILIRNPLDMLLSWSDRESIHQEHATIDTTGLPDLVRMYSEIKRRTGAAPAVVDMDALMADPPRIVSALCARLGIQYYPEMLSWPPGPKPDIDG